MKDSETDIQEMLDVVYFPEGVNPAVVSFSADLTRQIRSYEPMKVSCFVSLPCLPHEDEIRAAIEKAQEIVEAKMAEVNLGITEAISAKN